MKNFIALIKRAVAKIKNPWFRARSNYIKHYDTLPIKENCILLESQHGKEISGNIFYILKTISADTRFADWEIYVSSWIRHKRKISAILASRNIENVKIVTYASDEYFQLLASAKYLVNDNTFDAAFVKKEGQIYLNTWHGTPLKTLGRKMTVGNSGIGNAQKNFIVSDYILFPNQTTRDAIMVDYMVENLSDATEIYCGYPRNTAFFDDARRQELQQEFNPDGKRLYAYMPTFRGAASVGGTGKNDVYLRYYFFELDKQLTDDEILYVNLHPVAKKNIDFRQYSHIKAFPANIETYEFLNIADCLITDYSSVFFDFANTGRKIILFAYDREDYLADRGLYMDLDQLPFPKVYDVPTLLSELRTPKHYGDAEFLHTYCRYESSEAARQLCDFVFWGKTDEVLSKKNTPNGKENVLIYTGNLARNGVTVSLTSLLNQIDLEKRNYYLTFRSNSVKPYEQTLMTFPDKVNYIAMTADMNLTVFDRIVRKLFKMKWISAKRYVKLQEKRIQQNWIRCFGFAHFDTAIQFNGYEAEVILMWSRFKGNRVIYVHSDMAKEIKVRGNQRRDVLRYAYQTFDKVAIVTEDIKAPTFEIARQDTNFHVARNAIDHQSVIEKSTQPFELNSGVTSVYPSEDQLRDVLTSSVPKFINIGRFSPEKGQLRLLNAFAEVLKHTDVRLIIVGGSSNGNYYNTVRQHVEELGLTEHVILIKNMPNPYPTLAKCDYFVLSSFYEGFGLVLAEADILGKPAISTDIQGPKTFMKKYGGTLVEDSEQGIYQGMLDMLNGQVSPMNVDYAAYNREAIQEFEGLFSTPPVEKDKVSVKQ